MRRRLTDKEATPATVVVDGLRGRDVNRFKTRVRESGVNVRFEVMKPNK